MDDDVLPYEDWTTAAQTVVGELALAVGQLVHENRSTTLSQPSYLTVPPDPLLHRLAQRGHVDVADDLGGTVNGLVVQANSVSGGIHVHQRAHPRPTVPWQMSAASPRFVNRSRELATLDELLLGVEPRRNSVLLTGPAGVGKSAVARAWLWLRRDWFPDGILYADLRSQDDAVAVYRVLSSLLTALGVAPERMPTSVDACAALFRSLTATRRLAVLVEGATNAGQVRPLLPAGGETVVLVTSTRRLGLLLLDGAYLLPVEPLDEAEATMLLQRFAGADRVTAQAEAASRIARLCEGLPLALCVVGAQLATHTDRPLELVVQQLSDEDKRLSHLAVEGTPLVHHALDTGYQALTADAARLYRLLGALPISVFSAPVAAAAAQLTDRSAATLLGVLADAHLLREVGADVYRFYPLVALHAREAADADEGAATAVDRVVAWYLGSAVGAAGAVRPYRREVPLTPALPLLRPVVFNDLNSALDWLDAESPQVLAVARYCVAHQRTRIALELVGVMWALWAYRKYYPLWEEFDALGLSCTRALGDRDAQARMLRRLGLLCTDLGRYREAREYLQDAAELFETLGDVHRTATVLNSLGVVELRDGTPDVAVRLLTGALAIHQERGEQRQAALVLIDLADAELERCRRAQARPATRSHSVD